MLLKNSWTLSLAESVFSLICLLYSQLYLNQFKQKWFMGDFLELKRQCWRDASLFFILETYSLFVLDTAEIIFISIFSLELLTKFFAFGVSGYFRSLFNTFDCVVSLLYFCSSFSKRKHCWNIIKETYVEQYQVKVSTKKSSIRVAIYVTL